MTSSIAANLGRAANAVREAEIRYGRKPGSVKLLAVGKTRTTQEINAAIAAGQRLFGESYLQEAQKKILEISGEIGSETGPKIGNGKIEWHFIGPVQSNKTRRIASLFSWVHGVDRESVARRLSAQRPAESAKLNVCVQVNLGGEATKSGVAPDGVEPLLQAVSALPGLNLRGLMAIPAPENDAALRRRAFAALKRIFDDYAEAYGMDTLSMGMSGDFEEAIAEGATIVRLGTAVFGARK